VYHTVHTHSLVGWLVTFPPAFLYSLLRSFVVWCGAGCTVGLCRVPSFNVG
jgi:hypothetical protein